MKFVWAQIKIGHELTQEYNIKREGEYRTTPRVTTVRTVHDLLMIFIYGGCLEMHLYPCTL